MFRRTIRFLGPILNDNKVKWCLLIGFILRIVVLSYTYNTLPLSDECNTLLSAEAFDRALHSFITTPSSDNWILLRSSLGGIAYAHFLYRIFVWFTYGIFGSTFVLGIAQILLQLIAALGLAIAAKQIWSKKAFYFILFGFTFYPSNIIYPHIVMTENLFFIFLVGTILFVKWLIDNRGVKGRYLFIFGIFTMIGLLVRNVLRPLVLLNIIFITVYTGFTFKTKVLNAFYYISGIMIIFALVSIPASLLKGEFYSFGSRSGLMLYWGNNPLLLRKEYADRNPILISGFREELVSSFDKKYDAKNDNEKDDLMFQEGVSFISNHPYFFIKQGISKLTHLWYPIDGFVSMHLFRLRYPFLSKFSSFGSFFLLLVLSKIAIISLAIISIFVAPNKAMKLWLLCSLILSSSIHFVTLGDSRYLYGYMPLIFLLASGMASTEIEVLKRKMKLVLGIGVICIWLFYTWILSPKFWQDVRPSNFFRPLTNVVGHIIKSEVKTFDHLVIKVYKNEPDTKRVEIVLSDGNFMIDDSLMVNCNKKKDEDKVIATDKAEDIGYITAGFTGNPNGSILVKTNEKSRKVSIRNLLLSHNEIRFMMGEGLEIGLIIDPLHLRPQFLPALPSDIKNPSKLKNIGNKIVLSLSNK